MELFDDYALQVYISSAWVDLTVDLLLDPPLKWNCGIMSNDVLARIGDAGLMEFALNNTSSNNAGLEGYYSPGHANCMAGWTVGLPVRLLFWWDDRADPWVKYYGRILPEGIQVKPGRLARHIVTVACEDWMGLANRHYLRLMEYATDKRADEAIPLLLAEMPIQPTSTSLATGIDTFPTLFDTTRNQTTASGELNKIALSEFGYIYCRSDGTLVFDARTTRSTVAGPPNIPMLRESCPILTDESGDTLTDESGDTLVEDGVMPGIVDNAFSEMAVSYGRALCNQARTTAYPRKVDAAATTVLFSLNKPFEIKAGQTITGYRCKYRDPSGASTRISGTAMVTPVATTDYTANTLATGLGVDRTASLTVVASYGTEAVEYTLTAALDLWVTKLQARGKGIYIYDSVEAIQSDAGNQLLYGLREKTLDVKYQHDPTVAQTFTSYIMARDGTPRYDVDSCSIWVNRSELLMMAFLEQEPGYRLSLKEDLTAIDDDYYINGYSATLLPVGLVQWSPVLTNDPGYYVFGLWDSALWDVSLWGP